MFTLPAILFEERYSVGSVQHVIRPPQVVTLVAETLIHVSPRIRQPLKRYDNDERVIVTSRRDVQLPDGVDGVLFEDNGSFVWARHRLLDEFKRRRAEIGPEVLAREVALRWEGALSYRAEKRGPAGIQLTTGLRPPQLGALHAIGAHWSLEQSPATVVMPTGTGKTETMLAALAAFGKSPLLVVVPWDALRLQTAYKFLTFGLLRSIGVLPVDVPNPIVGIMSKRPKSLADLLMFQHCNVIVTTIGSIGVSMAPELIQEMAARCQALILDEAHHVPATTWTHLKTALNGVPTLQITKGLHEQMSIARLQTWQPDRVLANQRLRIVMNTVNIAHRLT